MTLVFSDAASSAMDLLGVRPKIGQCVPSGYRLCKLEGIGFNGAYLLVTRRRGATLAFLQNVFRKGPKEHIDSLSVILKTKESAFTLYYTRLRSTVRILYTNERTFGGKMGIASE